MSVSERGGREAEGLRDMNVKGAGGASSRQLGDCSHEVVTARVLAGVLDTPSPGGGGRDLLSEVVVVDVRVGGHGNVAARAERDLGLLRLGLLAALLGRLLLLQLLVAEGRQAAGDLLDLVRRQVLGELLRELLQEDDVVRLARVGRQQRDQRVAQLLELQLRLRVEEGQRVQVDGLGRVGGVDDHGVRGRRGLAVIADADGAEEVLGVLEVGLLLGAAQALAARRLALVARGVAVLLEEQLLRGDALGDALGLGLLVRGGLGVGLGLLLRGDLGLLALDLGVLGGVPGV